MKDVRENSTKVESEKAILVRVQFTDETWEKDPLAELRGLAKTAGAVPVGTLTQRRDKPDMTTCLGRGKVEELTKLVKDEEAEIVLFDNVLTPGQIRNLERAIEARVVDRTELILDIFATHAQTHEARLAVELAQSEYSLPRLKRMWTHLSRIKMGIGMRGPGEKQLEVDKRLVEKRIADLRRELTAIERRKEREVANRYEHLTVSLVGYTNAGKSTLMNALTGAGVYAADKLFATLTTRTRRWQLPNWGPVLLSDTVGFIRDLPHGLIASFRATLEEARQADLLLHVADASNPAVLEQIASVVETLREIGIDEKDLLLVLNKVDELPSCSLGGLLDRYPHAVAVSAVTGEGLDRLAMAVSDALARYFRDVDVELSVADGKLMAFLAEHGEVLSRTTRDERSIFHVRIPERFLGRITSPDVVIRDRMLSQPAQQKPLPGAYSVPDADGAKPSVPPATNGTVLPGSDHPVTEPVHDDSVSVTARAG